MLTTPQEYVESLEGPGRAWLVEFLSYMQNRHSDIPPVMFRQRPMFTRMDCGILQTDAEVIQQGRKTNGQRGIGNHQAAAQRAQLSA